MTPFFKDMAIRRLQSLNVSFFENMVFQKHWSSKTLFSKYMVLQRYDFQRYSSSMIRFFTGMVFQWHGCLKIWFFNDPFLYRHGSSNTRFFKHKLLQRHGFSKSWYIQYLVLFKSITFYPTIADLLYKYVLSITNSDPPCTFLCSSSASHCFSFYVNFYFYLSLINYRSPEFTRCSYFSNHLIFRHSGYYSISTGIA